MPLSDQFKKAVQDALVKLYPVHAAQAPIDYRRVLRPTGPGTHSISIEPYRGSSTFLAFYRFAETASAAAFLTSVISEHQPELSYHLVLPGRAIHLGDSISLLATWCNALEQDPMARSNLPQAIDTLLLSLENLLDGRRLTQTTVTSVAGLNLVDVVEPILIDNGVYLRRHTEEELVELGASDITFGTSNDLLTNSVSCCIEFRTNCNFTLEETHPQSLVVPDVEPSDRTANVIRALHVLKSGRAGVYQTKNELRPRLFPNMDGGSSWPLNRPLFASLDVTATEVPLLLDIERELRAATRQELRIASDRLVDAENRLSPIDALLDAVIGLEVVLNPMDSSELAFRVALNYAFLAPPEYRRERYDRVRLLQKTRNKVVHGGLNLQSPDSATIHEQATLAKACLRDVLQSFLLDKTLKGNQKLDADFWLDRVLPPSLNEPKLVPPESK